MAAVVFAAMPAPAQAAGLKVVIIVGPTGSQTAAYRGYADEEGTAAIAAGATVVKVYSPNATWSKVKAAVLGANIVIYHGHGNGFPNPYNSTETTSSVNGWGLNKSTSGGDSDSSSSLVYCGEKALLGTLVSTDRADQWNYCGGSSNTDGIAPAANFVMIYANACYAPGAGEKGSTTDLTTARARVANYSYPVLKLGAGAYFSTDMGADTLVSLVLRNRTMSFGEIFRRGNGYDATALKVSAHPNLVGDQVWVQRTYNRWLGTDYWYGYGGNPNATPSNANIAPPVLVAMDRLAGADRYATAAAVSAQQFAPGVAVAYVATGANFPDALAGGAVAARNGGPVLLVAASGVPAATASELGRLKPQSIVVLGGEGAVSKPVMDALDAYTTGSVQRIAGANRYETAASISASTFDPGVPAAYIATGTNFPDALAGVPATGVVNGPVLLVAPTSVPDATAAELTRLKPGRIVILGASGVISDGVATQLDRYTVGSVSRLAGSDRYATAVAISSSSFSSSDVVFVATGVTFPDALGGGPVAGIQGGPLLLVPGSSVPSSVAAELKRLDPQRVVILGGTSVVSPGVADQIESLLAG